MIQKLIKLTFGIALVAAFTSCDKADVLALYSKAGTNTLSSSLTVVAPPPTDADNEVVKFSWSDPKLGTDSNNYKFVLEFDTATSFSNPVKTTVTGNKFSRSFTGAELNAILLGWKFPFGVARNVSVRLSSSYANNNDYSYSTPIVVSMASYRIPPKVAVPPALYIVGDLNGWNNSGGLDRKYAFYQTDETTYTGVFEFTAAGGYKLIQELGNWDSQFRRVTGDEAAGAFDQKNADPTFPNPATPGWYRVVIDFQNGVYSTTKTDAARVIPPANLYIVGDVNGWNNSGSLDTKYKFTKVDEFLYTCDVAFSGGGGFKLIQELGNWDTQFRRLTGDATAGEFDQKNADPTIPNPSEAGNYRVSVNFATCQYKIVKL